MKKIENIFFDSVKVIVTKMIGIICRVKKDYIFYRNVVFF